MLPQQILGLRNHKLGKNVTEHDFLFGLYVWLTCSFIFVFFRSTHMAFYFKLKCLLIVCQKKKKMFTYKTFYILSYENLNLYKYRLIMDEVPYVYIWKGGKIQ